MKNAILYNGKASIFPESAVTVHKNPDQRPMIDFFRKNARWIAALMVLSFVLTSFIFLF